MMNSKRPNHIRVLAVICAVLLASACRKDLIVPAGPGELKVNLSTTASSGAAFLLTITGPDIANPTAAAASDLVYSFTLADGIKVAVIGEHASGTLLRFSVPETGRFFSYRVTLHEVAGTDNALLTNSDYTLTITQ